MSTAILRRSTGPTFGPVLRGRTHIEARPAGNHCPGRKDGLLSNPDCHELILAEDLDLCRAPYEVVRGRDVFPPKLQALENFRRAHMTSSVLFQPSSGGSTTIRWAISFASLPKTWIPSRASTSSPSLSRDESRPLPETPRE